jgi:hypothetical protein
MTVSVTSFVEIFDCAFNKYVENYLGYDTKILVDSGVKRILDEYIGRYINGMPIFVDYIVYGSKSLFIPTDADNSLRRIMLAYDYVDIDMVTVNRIYDTLYSKYSKHDRFFEACDNLSYAHFLETLGKYKLYTKLELTPDDAPLYFTDGNDQLDTPTGVYQTMFEQYVEQYLIGRGMK